MNYLSLILRIFAIAAAAVAGALFFSSKGKLEKKDAELSQVQAELRTLLDIKESASLEVSSLQEELAAKTKRLEESKTQLEELQAELAVEKQETARVQIELSDVKRDTAKLKETADRLRQELVGTESSLAAASQESKIAQLNERIEKLLATNIQLRKEIEALEALADNNSILDSDSKNKTGLTEFTPKTLTLNEVNAIKAETKIVSLSVSNGIVVLNAKPELNLKPGSVIGLVKGPESIAQVKVININGALAIANILPGAKLENLSKGDTVKILR